MAWCLCGAQLQGCLLPPPVEEVTPVDNNAPRIIPERLNPGPDQGPVEISELCPPSFNAALIDPDGDTLHWRVFVDYFVGINRTPEPRVEESDPTGSPVTLTFTPNPDELGPDNPHTVELLVADRPFFSRALDNEGRDIESPGLATTFVWTIEVDPALDAFCP